MQSQCCHLSKSSLPGEVSFARVSPASLASDEVRIAPSLVGLCGSDLRLLRNEKAHLPGVFGHEVVARVVQIGSAVREFERGDLVTVNPVNEDDDGDIIGYNGTGFLTSDFVVNSEVLAQGRLMRLPAHVSTEEAVFAEPLACCVRAQRELKESLRGARVVVVGSGSFGLLHYLLARSAGAEDVLLASRGAGRAQEAVRRGIATADHVARNDDRTHPLSGRAHVVIVTANGAAAIRESLHWAAPGAIVLLFGGLASGDMHGDLDLGALRRAGGRRHAVIDGKGLVLIGSYGTDNSDFHEAIRLIADGRLGVARLVTHRVALAALPGLLRDLAKGVVDGIPVLKMVVRCS